MRLGYRWLRSIGVGRSPALLIILLWRLQPEDYRKRCLADWRDR
jgi:hypothetical protein